MNKQQIINGLPWLSRVGVPSYLASKATKIINSNQPENHLNAAKVLQLRSDIPSPHYLKMMLLDDLLHTRGIQHIGVNYDYLDTGREVDDPTIFYSHEDDEFFITSFADIIEECK